MNKALIGELATLTPVPSSNEPVQESSLGQHGMHPRLTIPHQRAGSNISAGLFVTQKIDNFQRHPCGSDQHKRTVNRASDKRTINLGERESRMNERAEKKLKDHSAKPFIHLFDWNN
jgi:hypothetical protein